MQMANIPNPFYKFIKTCNETWIDIDNIPRTSKDHIFGTCTFFDDYWKQENELDNHIPTIFIISIDGIGSRELYKIWEKHHLTNTTLIPEFIINHKNPIILFDNSAEGHCDEDMLKFVSQVVDMYKLNPNTTFYGNSAINIKEIHQRTEYTNFKTIYTANFQEDTMTELFEEFEGMDLEYTYENKTTLYNCLNNAPKPHRALLLGALDIEDNMVSTPNVDFQELQTQTIRYLIDQSERKQISAQDINDGLSYLKDLQLIYPLELDKRNDDIIHMKQISADSSFIKNLLDCDFQLITETFSDNTLVITEKIYKAIIMKQPFIIFGPHRIYKYLQSKGYKTYEHLITTNTWKGSSNYDSTTNIITKIKFLTQQLETLSMLKENPIKWQEIEQQNKLDAEHNYELFKHNMHSIKESSTQGLDAWLTNYADFNLLFDVDLDK
jgi:hypothetical protein